MKMRLAIPATMFAVVAAHAAIAGVEATDAAKVTAGTYSIDPSHVSVAARVNHMGFSTTTLRFAKVSGEFTYDPAHAEDSTLSVSIDTASLTTDWPARDSELKGPGFFNAAKFPVAQFVAHSLTKVDGSHARVTGQLTLLGVTKPVLLDVTFLGTGTGMMGDRRAGFEAHTTFNRSDFGMTTFLPAISDKVDVVIDAEFSKK